MELPYAPAADTSKEGHPYFVGVQYHPEFKSRHTRPSPPFLGLILAASGQLPSWLDTHGSNSGVPAASDDEELNLIQ